jgi:hypothetical protein
VPSRFVRRALVRRGRPPRADPNAGQNELLCPTTVVDVAGSVQKVQNLAGLGNRIAVECTQNWLETRLPAQDRQGAGGGLVQPQNSDRSPLLVLNI